MKTKIYYSLNKGIPFFLHKWGATEVESTTPCLSFRESECKVYVIIKKVTLITLCGAGEITDPVISHWRSASIFTCKNKFVIYRKGIRGSVRALRPLYRHLPRELIAVKGWISELPEGKLSSVPHYMK